MYLPSIPALALRIEGLYVCPQDPMEWPTKQTALCKAENSVSVPGWGAEPD